MTTDMPASGHAKIVIHADAHVLVRVSGWLEPARMKFVVNGRAIDPSSHLDESRHYAHMGHLSPGTAIDINFPLEDRLADERIGTTRYTLRWRGNYVIGMLPSARTLPLYP